MTERDDTMAEITRLADAFGDASFEAGEGDGSNFPEVLAAGEALMAAIRELREAREPKWEYLGNPAYPVEWPVDDTDATQAAIQAARQAADEEHRTLVTTRDLPYLAAIALIVVLIAIYALGVV